MTAAALPHPHRRAPARNDSAASELGHKTRQMLNREIDFIPNAVFRSFDPGDDSTLVETLHSASTLVDAPAGLPAHLRRLCQADLLSREQEQALFRQMNYLKYQANALRSRLDPDQPDATALEKINELLNEARTVRDHIIRANMRLVMAIVKKFVTPRHSFDDLLSEGTFTLMKAVDKFDYDRGFRFSTYAYRSIARNAYRTITSAQKEESRFARDAESLASEQEEDLGSAMLRDQRWSQLRTLTASMLDQLDRRERFIIRSRYALGAHRKVRTFQCLADKLGVSKERVRQLEHRALTKMRAMAAKLDVDEMVGLSAA